MHKKKTGLDLRLIANHPAFSIWGLIFSWPLAFRIATSYPRRGRSPNYSQRYEAWLLCSKWEQVYPSHHNHYTINSSYHISRYKKSGRRDSNPRPPPWQGDVLPLNYFRILVPTRGFEPPTLWLQIRCSASWAKSACLEIIYKRQLLKFIKSFKNCQAFIY